MGTARRPIGIAIVVLAVVAAAWWTVCEFVDGDTLVAHRPVPSADGGRSLDAASPSSTHGTEAGEGSATARLQAQRTIAERDESPAERANEKDAALVRVRAK